MGIFMQSKGIQRGKEISKFKFVNMELSWQSDESNYDCGLFLMMHMLLYCGIEFDCDLGDPEKRILYRAEIGATLLLSDFNKTREDFLRNVQEFSESKALILPGLLEKREEKKKKKELEAAEREKRIREKNEREKAELERDGVDVAALEQAEIDAVALLLATEEKKKKAPLSKKRKAAASKRSPKGKVKRTCSTPNQPIVDRVFNSPSSALGKHHRVSADEDLLGCTLDCGQPDTDPFLVSNFMRTNKILFSPILSLRKEVADYYFLDDHTLIDSTWVFSHGSSECLTRKDMQSLLPTNNMEMTVVDCWSRLLNELEFNKPSTPRKLYFGIQHVVFRIYLFPLLCFSYLF